MVYDKYCELCTAKGVAPTTAAMEAGISKSTVTKWKNNPETTITSNILKRLSAYFEMSPYELMQFFDDTKKAPSDNGGRAMELDDFSYAFHELSGDLTDDQKAQLLQLARLFVEDKNRHEQEEK